MVVEMLQALDETTFDVIADLFRKRIQNVLRCDVWQQHVVALLKKAPGVDRCRDLRPIAVLHVMYKLFSSRLLKLTAGSMEVLSAPQFAFR